MRVRDRIKQICDLGIGVAYESGTNIPYAYLSSKDRHNLYYRVTNEIIAIFEDGEEHCQLVSPGRLHRRKISNVDGNMIEVLRREGVDVSKLGSIRFEPHYVVDRENEMVYIFSLPSRDYLKNGKD